MKGTLLNKIKLICFALVTLYALFFSSGWCDATKWVEAGPGGGGAVRDFAFDPELPDRVYLTSDMNGVFMSDDAGDTWQWSSYGASNGKGGIAADPNNPNILYSVGSDGVYQTKDKAKHWNMVYSKGNGFRGINNLTFGTLKESIFGDPGEKIAVGTSSAVYVSTVVGDIIIGKDGGRNWSRMSTGGKSKVVAVVPIDKQRLVAALYDEGIFISKDQGDSWVKVFSSTGQNFFALSIHPLNRTLYALAGRPSIIKYSPAYSANNFPLYLYRSDDDGETWKLAHTLNKWIMRNGRNLMDISKEGTILIITDEGPIRSADGGRSWVLGRIAGLDDNEFIYHKLGKTFAVPYVVAADPHKKDRWYLSGMIAAFRSDDDGKTWKHKVNGLRQDGYWFIRVNPKNPETIIASDMDHGLIRSVDGGSKWHNIIIDNPYEECDELRFSPNDNEHKTMYALFSWHNPFIAKSTDAGETWKIIKHWHGKGRGSLERFTLIKREGLPAMLVGEAGVGIWRSMDEGESWELKNRGLPKGEDINYIQFIESDKRGYLYVGIMSRAEDKGGIFSSTDGGETWSKINQGLNGHSGVRRKSFEIDPNNPDVLWVGAERGVFRSVNRGKKWEKRIDGVFASAILVEPGNSDNVYVVSFTGGGILEQYTSGIYKSVDGGNYFFRISDELLRSVGSTYAVYDLEYGWKGPGHIWAAPLGGGLIYTLP